MMLESNLVFGIKYILFIFYLCIASAGGSIDVWHYLRKAERAEFALVGLLAGVDPEMLRQSARVAESLLAQPASEGRKR